MNENKRIIKAFIVICLLFIAIICYLSIFELFFKEDIIDSPYNRRIRDMGVVDPYQYTTSINQNVDDEKALQHKCL